MSRIGVGFLLAALALALALGTFVGARLALWLVLWRSGAAPAVPWREPYADDVPDPYAVTGI